MIYNTGYNSCTTIGYLCDCPFVCQSISQICWLLIWKIILTFSDCFLWARIVIFSNKVFRNTNTSWYLAEDTGFVSVLTQTQNANRDAPPLINEEEERQPNAEKTWTKLWKRYKESSRLTSKYKMMLSLQCMLYRSIRICSWIM